MRTGVLLACLCCLMSLVTSGPQYRQRLGPQRGQRGRGGQGRRRTTPAPVLEEEYDDGTDYGGSYSFEDERYGGGGRRRGGYERQTTQRSHSSFLELLNLIDNIIA